VLEWLIASFWHRFPHYIGCGDSKCSIDLNPCCSFTSKYKFDELDDEDGEEGAACKCPDCFFMCSRKEKDYYNQN
jgi:hypothetical protein